jgi:hypothetical protein
VVARQQHALDVSGGGLAASGGAHGESFVEVGWWVRATPATQRDSEIIRGRSGAASYAATTTTVPEHAANLAQPTNRRPSDVAH